MGSQQVNHVFIIALGASANLPKSLERHLPRLLEGLSNYWLTHNFPSPWKGYLVLFTQCWLWHFHGQVLKLKWDLSVASWHWRWAIMREKFGINNPWNLNILTIEGSDARENAMFYPQKRTFDPSISPRKWAEGLCDPLDGNNSIAEHLHKFSCQMCKPQ